MNATNGAGAFRRLVQLTVAAWALFCASGAALAQISVDTQPPAPRAGDYVTLNISASFDREDFWVTSAELWELRPASTGSTREYIAEVHVYYRWAPRYNGGPVRTPFTATVGLGQFTSAAEVEVHVRF